MRKIEKEDVLWVIFQWTEAPCGDEKKVETTQYTTEDTF